MRPPERKGRASSWLLDSLSWHSDATLPTGDRYTRYAVGNHRGRERPSRVGAGPAEQPSWAQDPGGNRTLAGEATTSGLAGQAESCGCCGRGMPRGRDQPRPRLSEQQIGNEEVVTKHVSSGDRHEVCRHEVLTTRFGTVSLTAASRVGFTLVFPACRGAITSAKGLAGYLSAGVGGIARRRLAFWPPAARAKRAHNIN
jgi:hypothetical protein